MKKSLSSLILSLASWVIVASVWAVPPSAPGQLWVSERPCSYNTRSVYIDWVPSFDAAAYRLYRNGSIFKATIPVQHDNEGLQHYTHWWIEEGVTSTYWVTALSDLDEESAPSPSGTITTTACGLAPSQPQDLAVVPTSCTTTLLIWTPSDGGAYPLFAYMVRRSGEDDLEEMTERGSSRVFRDWVWNPPRGVPEPPNFYFDDGVSGSRYGDPLEGGKTFYYSVQAYNFMANSSPPSEIVEVVMPPCP